MKAFHCHTMNWSKNLHKNFEEKSKALFLRNRDVFMMKRAKRWLSDHDAVWINISHIMNLHLWIVLQFFDVPLDNFYVPFVYLGTDVLAYLDTAILRIRHSTWIASLFVPILPWMFATLSLFGCLEICKKKTGRKKY